MIEFDKSIKFLNTIYKGTNFGKQFRMDNQALLQDITLHGSVKRNGSYSRRTNNSIDVRNLGSKQKIV